MNEIANERVELGKTGIMVSPLGIGTWQWGDRSMWGYGKGEYTDNDLKAGFLENLKAGINFFDTAEVYGSGRSETLLGQFSQESGQSLVLATKFMPFPWRLRNTSLIEALHRSLQRLGVNKVDLYQIHFPFPPMPVEYWVKELASAVTSGLTRAVGVSNYSAEQTRRAAKMLEKYGLPLASNQVSFSLLDRKPERTGLLQTCQELGVTLIAYSPLGKGLLTGKYSSQNPPPGMRALTYRRVLDPVQPLISLMREIGTGHGGKSPAQVALNWTMCKGSIPIPGSKNLRQAKENEGAIGWKLTPEEVSDLDKASVRIS